MSKLYEKLKTERDKSIPTSKKRAQESDIYAQLLSIAFCNTLNPDELPPNFKVYNVQYDKSDFEDILEKVGISANVSCVYSTYTHGNTFAVTLKESKK